MNDTNCAALPLGYSHHGDCTLICKPTKWTDVVVFLLGNYAAHAATVVGRPGQTSLSWLLSIVMAICFPGAGVFTAVQAIASRAVFAPSELTMAARAGALCIVVKADSRDRLQPGEASHGRAERQQPQSDEEFPASISCTKVQGITRLPYGYRLLVLPKWTKFVSDAGCLDDGSDVGRATTLWARLSVYLDPRVKLEGHISCSYNVLKVLVSLGQLIFSTLTIYRARGDQVQIYGYAAFGLTVAPYAWMSFVNLVANLACPQYETMFVVNSPALDKLRQELRVRGLSQRYALDGAVGRISSVAESRVLRDHRYALLPIGSFQMLFESIDSNATADSAAARTALRNIVCAAILAAFPIAIIGALSGYDPGSSRKYQRVWTTVWLCLGPPIGAAYGMIILPLFESRPVLWRMLTGCPTAGSSGDSHRNTENSTGDSQAKHRLSPMAGDKAILRAHQILFWAIFTSMFAYMVPAIGGLVVVSRMLHEYGICERIA